MVSLNRSFRLYLSKYLRKNIQPIFFLLLRLHCFVYRRKMEVVFRNRIGDVFRWWWEWASTECLYMALHFILLCSDRPSSLVTLYTSNIVGQFISERWSFRREVLTAMHADAYIVILIGFGCYMCRKINRVMWLFGLLGKIKMFPS